MRRLAVTTAVLAALWGAVAARAADSPAAAPAVAKVMSCDLSGPNRTAVFYGRMEGIPGATKMSMRFTLLERLGRGSWTRVDVPALRQWRRAAPGVKAFGYKQTVENLRSGAAYKARIVFRWSTGSGVAIAGAVRETPVCRGALPNLMLAKVDVRSGPTDDTRTYRVTIENTGRADADAFDVVLSVDRAVLDAITVDGLERGESRTVSFVGPQCGRAVRVEIDPDNSVGERQTDDNSQLLPCP